MSTPTSVRWMLGKPNGKAWQGTGAVALAVVLAVACYDGSIAAAEPEKKIIEFGWDIPTPEYLVRHHRDMEQLPFDGVVIDLPLVRGKPLDGNNNSFAMNVFGAKRFELAQFREDIDDLRSLRLTRLTDNFLRLGVTPGSVDWFDEFGTIIENVKTAAAVVQQAGLKGICFDAESYKFPIWCYPRLKYADSKTFQEYSVQVRDRGRQFIAALNRELPDAVVLILPYTFRAAHEAATGRGALESWSATQLDHLAGEPVVFYGLLPAFVSGMIEAATEGTILIDGWEKSYGYRFAEQFRLARDTVLRRCRQYCDTPEKFDRRLQVGFGIWLDFGSRPRAGWDPADFAKNYFTPQEFEWSVRHALAHSDRYVWIYSERLSWWDRTRLPTRYIQALKRARQPAPTTGQPLRSLLAADAGINYFANLSARDLPGSTDRETFADLSPELIELKSLPELWQFKPDSEDLGVTQKWFAVDFADADWRRIRIGDWWERSGVDYDGVGWYRVRFEIPSLPKERRVWIYFGAVDESATVYLNGSRVGEHDKGIDGWNERFGWDVTDLLRKDNTIAVRVLDRAYGGGIWKSVKLFLEK